MSNIEQSTLVQHHFVDLIKLTQINRMASKLYDKMLSNSLTSCLDTDG